MTAIATVRFEETSVERKVIDTVREPAEVLIFMTPREAIVLKTILRMVGGSPEESCRGDAERILDVLHVAGVPAMRLRDYDRPPDEWDALGVVSKDASCIFFTDGSLTELERTLAEWKERPLEERK